MHGVVHLEVEGVELVADLLRRERHTGRDARDLERFAREHLCAEGARLGAQRCGSGHVVEHEERRHADAGRIDEVEAAHTEPCAHLPEREARELCGAGHELPDHPSGVRSAELEDGALVGHVAELDRFGEQVLVEPRRHHRAKPLAADEQH